MIPCIPCIRILHQGDIICTHIYSFCMQHPILFVKSFFMVPLLYNTKIPCSKILHPGDKICQSITPALSKSLVDFPKFTINFYWFRVIWHATYIKWLRCWRAEGLTKTFSLLQILGPQTVCLLKYYHMLFYITDNIIYYNPYNKIYILCFSILYFMTNLKFI